MKMISPDLSIAPPTPAERQLTGGILFLLAGLAALGALATNIILPAFPQIGASLGVSVPGAWAGVERLLRCIRVRTASSRTAL